MTNKFTVHEVFKKWTADIKILREGDTAYYYSSIGSREMLEDLAQLMIAHDIPKDDIWNHGYKKRVVNMLVHKEGKKGKGTFKGWVDRVENDFEVVMADVYVTAPEKTVKTKKSLKPSKNSTSSVSSYDKLLLPESETLKIWVRRRFGGDNEHYVNLLRNPTSTLFADFMQDMFGKNII